MDRVTIRYQPRWPRGRAGPRAGVDRCRTSDGGAAETNVARAREIQRRPQAGAVLWRLALAIRFDRFVLDSFIPPWQ